MQSISKIQEQFNRVIQYSQDIDNLITTEYEDKFSSKGMPIYAVVATKKMCKKVK